MILMLDEGSICCCSVIHLSAVSPLITLPSGWLDDSSIRREEEERLHKAPGTFTAGRRPTKKQEAATPGKLNLADYHHVSSALSRLNMKQRQAPLADEEEQGEEGGGYAVPQDVISGLQGSEYAQPVLQEQLRPKPRSKNRERRERAKMEYSDSETESSSDERPTKKSGASRKTRKKRSAIPVATPVVPNIPLKLPDVASAEKRKSV